MYKIILNIIYYILLYIIYGIFRTNINFLIVYFLLLLLLLLSNY